jgi:uncharacterized protein with HEPN domain
MKDPKLYLIHILECVERIERYTQGGADVFFTTPLVQDAVLRNLQILSESTQQLPEQWKTASPERPWAQIAGFRNRLVHDYLGLSMPLVWSVIADYLPPLRAVIGRLLVEMPSENPSSWGVMKDSLTFLDDIVSPVEETWENGDSLGGID